MNRRLKAGATCVSTALVLGLSCTRVGRAQEGPARFGDKRQVVITTDAAFSLSRTENSTRFAGSTTELLLRPAIDYFVIDRLSTGTFVGYQQSSDAIIKVNRFEVGARVGYAIPLSESFSVWPKLGASFSTGSARRFEDGTYTAWAGTLDAFVPLQLHAAQHFIVGLGPALAFDFAGERKNTVYSVHLTLGGWI